MSTGTQAVWRLFVIQGGQAAELDTLGRYPDGDIASFVRTWGDVHDHQRPGQEFELRDLNQHWAIRPVVGGISTVRSLAVPPLAAVEVQPLWKLTDVGRRLNSELKEIEWADKEGGSIGKGELTFEIFRDGDSWEMSLSDGSKEDQSGVRSKDKPGVVEEFKQRARQLNHDYRVMGADDFWAGRNLP
jgi:hypothetical protein